jgi:hypothetical protein
MTLAAAHASSSGAISLALPSASTALLRRTSAIPGLQTRRPHPVRRLREVAREDTMPAQSRIVLRGHAVCFR